MIKLLYISCCKTYLVAVRAVSVSSLTDYLLLRELALHCPVKRKRRVGSACYSHCLVYISTSRKRVSYCTAKACGCTTERLNLRRMIMRFIFKVHKPLLCHPVYGNGNHDTAGIDFVGNLHILKLSFFSELFHCHKCNVHQAHIFIITSCVQLSKVLFVFIKGFFDRLFIMTVFKGYILKLR